MTVINILDIYKNSFWSVKESLLNSNWIKSSVLKKSFGIRENKIHFIFPLSKLMWWFCCFKCSIFSYCQINFSIDLNRFFYWSILIFFTNKKWFCLLIKINFLLTKDYFLLTTDDILTYLNCFFSDQNCFFLLIKIDFFHWPKIFFWSMMIY